MVTKITEGIQVSAAPVFLDEHSSPPHSRFVFSYKITIENKSNYSVKLLRRQWYIFDSNGGMKEIEGKGVVGIQPVIAPGDVYEYESACTLQTEIGRMYGNYLMEKEDNRQKLFVRIPRFELIVPYKLN